MTAQFRNIIRPGFLIILFVIAPGCIDSRSQGGTGISELPVEIESESAPTEVSPSPIASEGRGRLEVAVRDNRDRPRSGVDIELSGPTSLIQPSDKAGLAVFDIPAGHYSTRALTGCKENLQILSGSSARVGVPGGETTRGSLQVTWRRRIVPAPPVFASYTPDWPIGVAVEVRFNVVDRCRDQARQPGGSFASFRIEKGGPIDFASSPEFLADRDGYARLRLICRTEGTPTVRFIDSENETDVFELTATDSSSGVSPKCKE